MELKTKITKTFAGATEKYGSIRAFATVTLDNSYCITGIKVMNGSHGLFVQMPASKVTNKDGTETYRDDFFPVTKEARAGLQKNVLEAYEKELEEQKSAGKPINGFEMSSEQL